MPRSLFAKYWQKNGLELRITRYRTKDKGQTQLCFLHREASVRYLGKMVAELIL